MHHGIRKYSVDPSWYGREKKKKKKKKKTSD
jgi:hypothetical protein